MQSRGRSIFRTLALFLVAELHLVAGDRMRLLRITCLKNFKPRGLRTRGYNRSARLRRVTSERVRSRSILHVLSLRRLHPPAGERELDWRKDRAGRSGRSARLERSPRCRCLRAQSATTGLHRRYCRWRRLSCDHLVHALPGRELAASISTVCCTSRGVGDEAARRCGAASNGDGPRALALADLLPHFRRVPIGSLLLAATPASPKLVRVRDALSISPHAIAIRPARCMIRTLQRWRPGRPPLPSDDSPGLAAALFHLRIVHTVARLRTEIRKNL